MISTLYTSIENWYYTAWQLTYQCGYSLVDVHSMIPFERDVYIDLIRRQQALDRGE